MRAWHRTFLLAALLGTAVAVPALAQTGGAPLTSYPACTTTPSKQDSEAAHNAFLAGKRFFDEADYASAVSSFSLAYKLDCTKPELLTIIARAHELNGNRPEAVHALEVYLQRAPNVSAEDKAAIQKRIENLKAQIAAQPPASAAPTAPASGTATATGPTATSAPSNNGATGGPAAERPHSVAPWILVGAGGVATVVGVVLLAAGAAKVSDAANLCAPNNVCKDPTTQQEASNKDSQGRSQETAGAIVGGIGVAALVGGLVWHFAEPTGPSSSGAHLRPSVGPGFAGLSLGGAF